MLGKINSYVRERSVHLRGLLEGAFTYAANTAITLHSLLVCDSLTYQI